MRKNSLRSAALLFVLTFSVPAWAQVSEADYYAQSLQNTLGYNYAMKYIEVVRAGWPPLTAYRAMYAYKNGWQVGYYRGWHEGAYQANRALIESWRGSFNQHYIDWLQFHQNTPWAQGVWGSFEKGFHDGYDKGRAAGWNQGRSLDSSQVPGPDLADFGRARARARSQNDPNDPWSDLRNVPMITGPGSF